MLKSVSTLIVSLIFFGCAYAAENIATVGFTADSGLVITRAGKTEAVIAVEPGVRDTKTIGEGKRAREVAVRPWEQRAADDLQKYIELISGAKPAIADSDEAVAAALRAKSKPVFILGELALKTEPSLKKTLEQAGKQNPELRVDAIVLRRKGNRIYIAGTNDDSHYYAVAKLLHLWGARWYLPTEIGECVPEHDTLTIDKLAYAYGSPFEIRTYWISWLGDTTGAAEFKRRNFMNQESVPASHRLRKYTGDLVEEGQSHWNVPIAEDRTVEHVVAKVEAMYKNGERFSLAIEDGRYTSDSPVDSALMGNIHDKYFLVPSLTDPFMVFYNKVAKALQEKYPDSDARIGFLSYVNITLPPQRRIIAEKPLVAYLAPIDIDPTHGMDDPRSPPRQEYREIMYRWSQVMQGRVAIYDYDQGMLVWRSIPNPSHQAFRQDVKHYRDAGVLGISTESRNAIATTFLNLHIRGQLMWEPDTDVDALLEEFYPKFYGPASEPMSEYWSAIFRAWEDTISTEHEFYVAPVVYTPELIETLRSHLKSAENAVAPLRKKSQLSRNEQLYRERVRFARLGFNVLDHYIGMVYAGARDSDYAAALAHGEKGLVARDALADMNPTFTTFRRMGDEGSAWFPGEVDQYRQLHRATSGETGELVATLPLQWSFRRDPNDTGVASGWAYKPADLTYWSSHKAEFDTPGKRRHYPATEWEVVSTHLYPQAQGIIAPDWQAYTGYAWYKTEIDLKKGQTTGNVHVRFPGLFAECWLYVNGYLVDHRKQNPMLWHNDYKFEWDVDLTGKLKPGKNDITLRSYTVHHISGMFRRPFLYRSKAEAQ